MLATVSPAASSVEETLSTLRYAQQARKIVNIAKVNEDVNAKLIRGEAFSRGLKFFCDTSISHINLGPENMQLKKIKEFSLAYL